MQSRLMRWAQLRHLLGLTFLLACIPDHAQAWNKFAMSQSGHMSESYRTAISLMATSWAAEPTKPIIDGEPAYENAPIGFHKDSGYFGPADVRRHFNYSFLVSASPMAITRFGRCRRHGRSLTRTLYRSSQTGRCRSELRSAMRCAMSAAARC